MQLDDSSGASEATPQTNKTCRMSPTLIPVILSAAKDLAERSDTDRVAGVRFFASLRTTGKRVLFNTRKSTRILVILSAAKDLTE